MILKLPSGCEVHYYYRFDESKMLVHVLDLHGPISVTNAIRHIQDSLCKKYSITIEYWNWILYGTDGVPAQFIRDSGFRSVNENLLDMDFKEIMLQRAI